MNKSMLRAIYNGERGNNELMIMKDEEHKRMSSVSDIYDELLKELTPKQKALQEKYVDAREYAACEELFNHFVEGFKIGLLLGIECMEE